jgi:hypothetical protein
MHLFPWVIIWLAAITSCQLVVVLVIHRVFQFKHFFEALATLITQKQH